MARALIYAHFGLPDPDQELALQAMPAASAAGNNDMYADAEPIGDSDNEAVAAARGQPHAPDSGPIEEFGETRLHLVHSNVPVHPFLGAHEVLKDLEDFEDLMDFQDFEALEDLEDFEDLDDLKDMRALRT